MSGGRYAYNYIDPLLHVPARLGIATALYAHTRGLSFVQLREVCELSDGNLSRHLQRLESEGIVVTSKEFIERIPRTTARLTPAGRRRFESYVEQLRRIVEEEVSGATAHGRSQGDQLAHD